MHYSLVLIIYTTSFVILFVLLARVEKNLFYVTSWVMFIEFFTILFTGEVMRFLKFIKSELLGQFIYALVAIFIMKILLTNILHNYYGL